MDALGPRNAGVWSKIRGIESQNDGFLFTPRSYQWEMLEASLEQNIIVAMDTGSGKTNIAVLRIHIELERCLPSQRVWFLCPSVALALQQRAVIERQLPAFQSLLISGRDGPDTWTRQSIWDAALANISIVVCTHQVLVDALSHGFVQLKDICLLVFDEAHHCVAGHPANTIMKYYHNEKRKNLRVPHVLGLTASPVMTTKGGVIKLETIERNLDSISRTPKLNRDELLQYVHLPEMEIISFREDKTASEPELLCRLKDSYRIFLANAAKQDPYIEYLRSQGRGADDPELRKALLRGKTYCQQQLLRLYNDAEDINRSLGTWACHRYIELCSRRVQLLKSDFVVVGDGIRAKEIDFVSEFFIKLDVDRIDPPPLNENSSLSEHTLLLIESLSREMQSDGAGIVFAQTRSRVKMLNEILLNHPLTRDVLRPGTVVGLSENGKRYSNLGDLIDCHGQDQNLTDLRTGTKNLIISTSVCEEGLDVAACNLVICFDKPMSLKAFIQRRGRARKAKSKYVIMFEGASATAVQAFRELEHQMKQKYMDDMRELEALQESETAELGYRDLFVPSTGARLTLDNAIAHLNHFCNQIPSDAYAPSLPMYSCETDARGFVRGRVLLPNSVDTSLRVFYSAKSWKTERKARMDAALVAYEALYKAGLVNNNLLPLEVVDEEASNAYSKLEKRPMMAMVEERMDPWRTIAEAWQNTTLVYQCPVELSLPGRKELRMHLASPTPLPELPKLDLFVDSETMASIEFGCSELCSELDVEATNSITMLILRAARGNRLKCLQEGFPLLFFPPESMKNPRAWLEQMRGTDALSDINPSPETQSLGLLRDQSQQGALRMFHGYEHRNVCVDEETGRRSKVLMVKARKIPRRTDFLHQAPPEKKKWTSFSYHHPQYCAFDRLPLEYAQFGLFIPSIMHHIENFLVAASLHSDILSSVEINDITLLSTATTAPSACKAIDYERLEFLGDSILKYHASLTLTANHKNWHEGLLSRGKDHIVSNGNLARAANRTHLSRYISREVFTGAKWQPLLNQKLLQKPEAKGECEISTKILADVVEALIGAAFIDGGEDKALRCLHVFLPATKWMPSAKLFSSLQPQKFDSDSDFLFPERYRIVESLLAHNFSHKALVIEALTCPSYVIPQKNGSNNLLQTTSSYQRLEFLGDSILDYIVTKVIVLHEPPIPLYRMNHMKAACVNAHFLAFLSLSHTFSVTQNSLVHSEWNGTTESRYHAGSPQFETTFQSLSLSSFLRLSYNSTLANALAQTQKRFDECRADIEKTLRCDPADDSRHRYPWVELVALSPEKVFSDVVESSIGALAVDGGLEACERFLETLGLLPWLRRVLALEKAAIEQGDEKLRVALVHPKQDLGNVAVSRTIRYEHWNDYAAPSIGQVLNAASQHDSESSLGASSNPSRVFHCRVYIDEEPLCVASGRIRMEAQTRAAAEAIMLLRARDAAAAAAARDAKKDDLEEDGRQERLKKKKIKRSEEVCAEDVQMKEANLEEGEIDERDSEETELEDTDSDLDVITEFVIEDRDGRWKLEENTVLGKRNRSDEDDE